MRISIPGAFGIGMENVLFNGLGKAKATIPCPVNVRITYDPSHEHRAPGAGIMLALRESCTKASISLCRGRC